MTYRYDEDLEFLKRLSSSYLKDLFEVLVYDEDRTLRMNEELTSSTKYKIYGRDYAKYPKRIAEELQCYGAILLLIFLETKGFYTKRFCAMCAII